jgi:hypothetical protein
MAAAELGREIVECWGTLGSDAMSVLEDGIVLIVSEPAERLIEDTAPL